MRPTLHLFAAGLLALTLWNGGCRSGTDAREQARADSARIADSIMRETRAANDLTSSALAYADSVLATLPLERKAAMTLMPALFARDDAYNMQRVMAYARDMGVGGIVLLKGSLPAVLAISDTVSSLGTPGMFLAVDAENGLRMRFPDAPEFPWSRELGRLTDDQVMYDFGRELARECRAVGINMVLGPVIDVVPGEGSHGLMRKRSLGSDPQRVADLAIAYSRGIEDGNVISVAKHFPGHGSASADSHKALGEIRSRRADLDSIDLYPFRRYVAEGLSGVMVGHLYVAALDSVRRPAVASPIVIGEVLRKELGFDGLVITDAINMEGALGVKAWQALAAGADMVMAPSDTQGEIDAIVEAVDSGKISESLVDARCRRILFYKYLVGAGKRVGMSAEEAVKTVNMQAPAVRDSISGALKSKFL